MSGRIIRRYWLFLCIQFRYSSLTFGLIASFFFGVPSGLFPKSAFRSDGLSNLFIQCCIASTMDCVKHSLIWCLVSVGLPEISLIYV